MISAKPWTVEAVARLFLGVIGTLCAGMVVAGWVGSSKKLPLSADDLEFLQMLIMIIAFQGAALGWMAFFLVEAKVSWTEAFGLRARPPLQALSLGLGAGIIVVPAMWFLQWLSQGAMEWIHIAPETQVAVQALQKPMGPWEKIFFGIFTILLAPVAEETLFRGVLYPTVKQTGHPHWALWGTSFLFALMHFNMASFVPLMALAVVLTLLYESTESLLTPMAVHGMFNAVNFFYLVFEKQIDAMLHVT